MDGGDGDPDGELVARVALGDAAAVRSLMARKLPRMLALAQRMLGDASEAEDVAQDVFVKVWREAANWRPGQARFDSWMHRVAINLCYDRLRRRRATVMADPPDKVDQSAPPDHVLIASDVGRRVQYALMALPDRQREALALCHYQELGNIEAAAIMDVTVEALESLLSRGRRGLRTALADLKP